MMITILVQISEKLTERVWPFQDRLPEIVELEKANGSTMIKVMMKEMTS
ncbi:MAG TPA: hypothetical protein VL334_23775 [Anaerolineae bacterium]|nr:hypothetical protein [Anaerolineae bacterium]